MARPKPLILIILDGFGFSKEKQGNPVPEAKTPIFDTLDLNFPFTMLHASGVAVGLPWGEAGNSEVGHLTIGSGKVFYHHLPRIVHSIRDGSFFENEAFQRAITHIREKKSRLHIAGLVSSGSVHSYIEHLYALLDLSKREKIKEVYLHIFTDGKDAPPKESKKFIALLEDRLKHEYPDARIASVVGRFYAMDRDEKWDRIETVYTLLTEGKGDRTASIQEYIDHAYREGLSDEFIKPAKAIDENGKPIGAIKDGDALIFFNFREDSMREITQAFVLNPFPHFPRIEIKHLLVVTMTEYQKNLPRVLVAFPQLDVIWPLAKVLGDSGLSHLHIAETEKYAHVTYFLNGGREEPFPGEERTIIPSFSTPHFDEMPEMKAPEITTKILENFKKHDVIIANLANADLVGHSGNFSAAIKAVEALDTELGRIVEAVLAQGGVALITADHGNIELKRDVISGEKLTEHSVNPVPLYLVGKEYRLTIPRTKAEIDEQKSEIDGILIDIAPTILELLGIKKPEEMTGHSLLQILKKDKG